MVPQKNDQGHLARENRAAAGGAGSAGACVPAMAGALGLA